MRDDVSTNSEPEAWRCHFMLDFLWDSGKPPRRCKRSFLRLCRSTSAGNFSISPDRKFLKRLERVVRVRGQVAVSALAANEAQFYSVSATGASLGAMAGGT